MAGQSVEKSVEKSKRNERLIFGLGLNVLKYFNILRISASNVLKRSKKDLKQACIGTTLKAMLL